MATNVVVSSLEFTVGVCEAESDASIDLELNDNKNCGRNCFQVGDTVFVKAYKYPLTLTPSAYSNVGNASVVSGETDEFDEFIVLDGYEGSVSKPITDIDTLEWFGLEPPDAGPLINNPVGSNRITAFPTDSGGGCATEDEEGVILPGVAHVIYSADWDEIRVLVTNPDVLGESEATALLLAWAEL